LIGPTSEFASGSHYRQGANRVHHALPIMRHENFLASARDNPCGGVTIFQVSLGRFFFLKQSLRHNHCGARIAAARIDVDNNAIRASDLLDQFVRAAKDRQLVDPDCDRAIKV
jgi:hypothetical protein